MNKEHQDSGGREKYDQSQDSRTVGGIFNGIRFLIMNVTHSFTGCSRKYIMPYTAGSLPRTATYCIKCGKRHSDIVNTAIACKRCHGKKIDPDFKITTPACFRCTGSGLERNAIHTFSSAPTPLS